MECQCGLVMRKVSVSDCLSICLSVRPLFFIGRAQSDPVWLVFSPVAGEKEQPDQVRPGGK